ncbi:uncharacterized protein LOC126657136 [Mercurialis annua]|uniref:uncharacterized protein LOC126657136 n=1 Tax=Mercurialis annua TaxID=3986 RepID=UPI00215E8AEC|nr:uncharacterized protein LOC126657136 [Mercurialis annua]
MISLIARYKLQLICIIESRVNVSQYEKVWSSISKKLPDWDIIHNYDYSSVGRIWILYDKVKLNVVVTKKHIQFIHVCFMIGEKLVNCSVTYGSYIANDRIELWENLCQISRNISCSWMVAVDFNAVMDNSNRLGGNEIDIQAVEEFKEAIKKPILLNWVDYWLDSFVNVLSQGVSDHTPLVVNLNVSSSWGSNWNGSTIFQVTQKLKALKSKFRELNKADYSDISQRVITMREMVDKLQADMIKDPFNAILHDEERDCFNSLIKLMSWEENIMRQKSRMLWIILGDQKNKFFHRSIKQRQSKLKIINLKLSNGSISSNLEDIKNYIVNHFKNFMGTPNLSRTNVNYDILRSGYVLSDEDWSLLDCSTIDDEIKKTLFSIKDEKAPGPDGYNSCFF